MQSKRPFEDPIRLATDGSAVGGGGDGDGGRGGSTEGIGGPQLPGGYKRGDVVYSKIHFAFNDLSIAPGDKGVVTGPCVSGSSTAKDRVSVDFENGMRVFASCSVATTRSRATRLSTPRRSASRHDRRRGRFCHRRRHREEGGAREEGQRHV